MDDLLILLRALHFAAAISLAGTQIFCVFVGAPVFGRVRGGADLAAVVRPRFAMVAWTSLGLLLATNIAWLIVATEQMSELGIAAIFSEGSVWTVLSATDFGAAWTVRTALAVGIAVLAVVGPRGALATGVGLVGWLCLVGSVGIVASLAFGGHAAAGSGTEGLVHLTADILHLIAAAAWVGALVPLALLIDAARRSRDVDCYLVAVAATLRFSVVGVVSVATLLVSGVVNTWVLSGSVEALTTTVYGRFLLGKIALFLVMVSIAGFNRQRLTPRLVAAGAVPDVKAWRQLRSNCLIEAALGAAVIGLVGLLGTLPPGLESQ